MTEGPIGKIVDTSETLPEIIDTSPTLPKVDPEMVARALGAEPVGEVIGIPGSPIAAMALRQEIARRLVSRGGRPALEGTTRRQKIPLADSDWEALGRLAELLEADGVRPTASQVASVILRQALESVDLERVRDELGFGEDGAGEAA